MVEHYTHNSMQEDVQYMILAPYAGHEKRVVGYIDPPIRPWQGRKDGIITEAYLLFRTARIEKILDLGTTFRKNNLHVLYIVKISVCCRIFISGYISAPHPVFVIRWSTQTRLGMSARAWYIIILNTWRSFDGSRSMV